MYTHTKSYLYDFVTFSNSAIFCCNAVWINLKRAHITFVS